MRRYIVLLLITETVWAQTDFDKICLIDGTEYLGEYLLTKGKTVHFKQRDESTFKKIPVTLIKSIEHRNGILTEFDINHSESEKTISTKISSKQIILYSTIAIIAYAAYLYFTFSLEYESDCVGFDCK